MQPAIGGGDTLFLSQVEAYKRLSPAFQKVLEGLRAVHSAVPQAEFSKVRGGPVRREPIETEVCKFRCKAGHPSDASFSTASPCSCTP